MFECDYIICAMQHSLFVRDNPRSGMNENKTRFVHGVFPLCSMGWETPFSLCIHTYIHTYIGHLFN